MTYRYRRIGESEIPAHLRWDVPRRYQGSDPKIEVAYATPHTRYEQDEGGTYKRVRDTGENGGQPEYFKLEED